jgi:hypothetical protein
VTLSGDCRFYFFIGWLGWLAAGWLLLFAEYGLRRPEWLSTYTVEAWLAMVVPVAAIAGADWLLMRQYEHLWFRFNRESLGPLVLERGSVERLRADLRRSLLLRWAMPPANPSVRLQLFIAAMWLPALVAPDGTPWNRRYREWLLDMLAGTVLGVAVVLGITGTAGWALPLAALLGGLALLALGFSLIRLAARRQAILDYFTAWRDLRPEAEAA